MLNKILVSTDGSPISFRALEFAMGVGKACGSEIVVLHVSDPFDLSKLHSYEMEQLDDDILEMIMKKEGSTEELTEGEKAKAGTGELETAKKKLRQQVMQKLNSKK